MTTRLRQSWQLMRESLWFVPGLLVLSNFGLLRWALSILYAGQYAWLSLLLTGLLTGLLSVILYLFKPLRRTIEWFTTWTNQTIKRINDQEFVFFSKGDDIASLNRVMIYIQENEETNRLRIVTVENEHFQAPLNLHRDIETLDRA